MKKSKNMAGEPTMVRLVWDDAWSDNERVSPESEYYEKEYLCVEAGYLKTANEREIVICRNWTPGASKRDHITFDACIRVPRGMVKSITVLALSRRLRTPGAGKRRAEP